ncbi:hypothetical protein Pmani_003451 [Petrolisthes manimaculis]|uniref:Dehydrogenase/reductase SDR family member 6 n=1 Tax=Petrolisthes manimaculis TaxID=1843537 RepID=A0AAE1UIG6_9EUCA|nr:hypothetical protein Pmani_003451 [Petrolisthes manimaculis]
MSSTTATSSVPSATGRLAGKRCVVTAAAQGIGLATVEAFLREGAALVVAVDINQEKLNQLASQSSRVTCRVLDVSDGTGIRALAKEFPDINVLFNCAGIVTNKTFLETTEEEWDQAFDVNVKSMFHTIQAFLPQMLSSEDGGSIINMGSVASTLRGIPMRSLYGSTKAAVIGLTKGVARDYIRQRIRCNVVCPSPVATPSYDVRKQNDQDSDMELCKHIVDNLTGRLASADEVANLCVYLASDESSYHTGNVFTIDGGFNL